MAPTKKKNGLISGPLILAQNTFFQVFPDISYCNLTLCGCVCGHAFVHSCICICYLLPNSWAKYCEIFRVRSLGSPEGFQLMIQYMHV